MHHKSDPSYEYVASERMRRTHWVESANENKAYTFFLRVFTLEAANPKRGSIGASKLAGFEQFVTN